MLSQSSLQILVFVRHSCSSRGISAIEPWSLSRLVMESLRAVKSILHGLLPTIKFIGLVEAKKMFLPELT